VLGLESSVSVRVRASNYDINKDDEDLVKG
jgi:hypothetical protein